MSHDPSRKHFLARLIGFVAIAGIAPKLLAKPAKVSIPATPVAADFQLRNDSRTVARERGQA